MALRNITKQVPVPNEPGEWVCFRIPGWRVLEESKKIKTRQSMANIRDLGGDIYKAIQEARTDTAVASVAADPLAEYDLDSLLKSGIKEWSYVDDDGKPIPVTPENIGALDDATAKWAARVIIGAEESESLKNEPDNSTMLSMDEDQRLVNG